MIRYDAILIGGGHNGLVTAAYLARAGHMVLLLERRPVLGGAAVTEEPYSGFKFDPGASDINWLHPAVVRDLELARHGLELSWSDPTLFAPLPDGDHLTLWRDPAQTADAIRRFSPADAGRWAAFVDHVAQLTTVLEALYAITPPSPLAPDAHDLLSLLGLGGRLRRFSREDLVEVLRTLPMSAAEFLDEWFESAPLKGALGAGGISGAFHGPRAAGTAYLMLHHQLAARERGLCAAASVRGGMGNLTRALTGAAKRHGVEIRRGTEVARVRVQDGRATGVLLASGEEIAARRVISNADPRRTFLGLVDPLHLSPTFIRQVENVKFRGAVAKVNLALDGLPEFVASTDGDRHLRGLIAIGPSLDYLERAYDDAKYGRISAKPYLAARIPSLLDPGLAPPGQHVLSIRMQYAPYHLREGTWDDARREALGDLVVETLAAYAPNLPETILHRQVLTPLDLEQTFGLTEGHIYHGEMSLDQILFMRPVPGWGRYRTPVRNLYLCGAGAHPGGGVTGAPGYNAAREILRDKG